MMRLPPRRAQHLTYVCLPGARFILIAERQFAAPEPLSPYDESGHAPPISGAGPPVVVDNGGGDGTWGNDVTVGGVTFLIIFGVCGKHIFDRYPSVQGHFCVRMVGKIVYIVMTLPPTL